MSLKAAFAQPDFSLRERLGFPSAEIQRRDFS
jgi:hypothetical protein